MLVDINLKLFAFLRHFSGKHGIAVLMFLVTLFNFSQVSAADSPSVPSSDTAAELRRYTQSLLDAIAPGDVAVWDRYLDDNAIQVDENNIVRNKSEQLKAIQPLGSGLEGRLSIAQFQIVEHGDTAVVTHEDDEYLNYYGQIIRSRFRMTDTWIHTSSGWKLLASQVLAVLKDPPSIHLESKLLCSYSGDYELTSDIKVTVRCDKDELLFERTGRPARHFQPEVADVFLEPGSPRTRRIFMRDTQGHITGFVDRREGSDILWRRSKTNK